ncbi:MAG TPA: hypothetical protein VF857_06100, partial [Spirochaetota bacterium]
TGSVEPHFALTSDLQYWINQDGVRLPNWWDVCDIVVAYWIYNLSTGKTYSSATSAECASYIKSLAPFEDWQIQSALGSFARHVTDVHPLYGAYLFNPSSLIKISQGGSGMKQVPAARQSGSGGLNLAKLALAGVSGYIGYQVIQNRKKVR